MTHVGHGTERYETIIIGGGQAGLSVGHHLSRRGRPCLFLDDRDRIGDAWRERWDSLRLFTPALFSSLDGMPMRAPSFAFVTKDEMGDYLEAYAAKFDLPVRTGTRVERLTHEDGRFVATAGARTFEADNVVVAMSGYQRPRVPDFAGDLDPDIVHLHSIDYRNPGQLRDGPVLLVGGGNTGAELAKELAPHHEVWMSGRDTGQIPFRIGGFLGRLFLVRLTLRGAFHRLLTVRTPVGRRVRPKVLHAGGPLIRVRRSELAGRDVRFAPKTAGVRDGLPVLEDGRVIEPANIIWCTGFHPGFDWIDLPVFDDIGDPRHDSGIVPSQPGLYFVGLHFLHAMSSGMIHGVGRDADRIASHIATHRRRASDRIPATQA
jgi:putative flavoprotein involved in K+ transport